MSFNFEEFFQNPSIQLLEKAKKDELVEIGKHFEISNIKTSQRKVMIRNVIIEHLVSKGIFTAEALEFKQKVEAAEALQMHELELKYQLERERMKHEYELKMKEIEMRTNIPKVEDKESAFDATKHIRLVPKFTEGEVDKYFLHFEKVALSLKWPKEVWTLLLQSVFIGKARDTFSSLSIEKSSDYETVKREILKAYELVPEAYRQKFRNTRKTPEQTHVEFARELEQLFDRWLLSKQVEKDFEKLRQMILLEQFKSCIRQDIKIHLDEQKVETLSTATTMSDSYALTHKTNFVNPSKPRDSKPFLRTPHSDHTKSQEKSTGVTKPSIQNNHLATRSKNVLTCSYCRKKGHLMSECWNRERDEKRKTSPNACAAVKQNSGEKVHAISAEQNQFEPYITEGYVSVSKEDKNPTKVRILRDTGASQTLMLDDVVPLSNMTSTQSSVLIQGVDGIIKVPLHKIYLNSEAVKGPVTVGIRPTLPIKGISILLGNDLASDKLISNPIVTDNVLLDNEEMHQETKDVYPACAITRAMQKRLHQEQKQSSVESEDLCLADTMFKSLFAGESQSKVMSESSDRKSKENDKYCKSQLVAEQKQDESLSELFKRAVTEQEMQTSPVCFFKKNGVLMRKWRPPNVDADNEWTVCYQIVIPTKYRVEVMKIAHDFPMAGHLGVNKTHDRVISHFYWPGMRKDISNYCKSCHTCQIVGKPNQKIPKAPLKPIPAFEEPFSRVLVDCVGPLPKTKAGNQYLLTLMCASTRFPEAIPLRNIKAKTIVKALIKFFTLVGLPKSIQSDQGTNFMSNLFQQITHELGIEQFKSTAYHPESQGALERFHQTLKNMMRSYCLEHGNDWDEGVHLLLFAARESVQESLGFSPFQLVFGHSVRGPLKVLKEKWLKETDEINLLDYVSSFKQRLAEACKMAGENLKVAQVRMKGWYDERTRERSFNVGDRVLVLLPVLGHPLQARYYGPFEILSKVNDLNYVVKTTGRRKERRLCHINTLKEYVDRNENKSKPVMVIKTEDSDCSFNENSNDRDNLTDDSCPVKLLNSDILANLDKKLSHLPEDKRDEMKSLIFQFKHLFPDIPSRTDVVVHDIDVGDTRPIKQHPYRVNPTKAQQMRKEIEYMLENEIIERSSSPWSSPCVLVPKPDGSVRFCTDFRKVNSHTKTDSYPIPRIEDCIDKIGHAKFVSKFDLLKGYWQIPLTERAKLVSAFVTPDGFYQYKVMPFGMKNAPATFQRMVNALVSDLDNTEGYVDDIATYSETWSDHVSQLRALFVRLSEAKLTINLLKSEFCKAVVDYLGHRVGQGQVRPLTAKIQGIVDFPTPQNRRAVMRYLGMAGYYRKFCPNFSTIAQPLTNLLQKKVKFIWTDQCQTAFDQIKSILVNEPVLVAPDFSRPFQLMVDASDIGIGSVLAQEDDNSICHPVCYYSRKLDKHQQNYSTIEKECLGLLLSLQHFEVYLKGAQHPVVVYTDHNPITFINKMKNKNQRLLRWSLTMSEYCLDIRHINGKDNVVADALSRAN